MLSIIMTKYCYYYQVVSQRLRRCFCGVFRRRRNRGPPTAARTLPGGRRLSSLSAHTAPNVGAESAEEADILRKRLRHVSACRRPRRSFRAARSSAGGKMPPIAETVVHGGVRLLEETSAVLACAPSRSCLCCRACVLAPLRRAFGAVLFAVLSVCCVRCSVLRSAHHMSQPTLRGDLYAPCGRAPPLFCIAEPPDTQHLVGRGGHTSRLWGNVLACAKRAPNLAV